MDNLQPYNTLALPAYAAALHEPETVDALQQLLAEKDPAAPVFVLGEGSNLVLRGNLPGLTIRPAMGGMRLVREDNTHVWVAAGAGVHWDDFVCWTVEQGWQGLENLSLIPGTVGAAPYQNIGAYGVELAQWLECVTVLEMATGNVQHIERDECDFGYRESRFKRQDNGRFIITGIELRLNKQAICDVRYGPLAQRFANVPATDISPAAVREAVIEIRQSKLPDPAVLPNAGSFFKNPVVSNELSARLKKHYPDMPVYPQEQGCKLAAGWLIEQSGWKGRRLGPVGMHTEQALVLVNYGGASCEDVQALADAVQQAVLSKFDVRLEQEPVLLP